MSELMNEKRHSACSRWRLLTTVSATTLLVTASLAPVAAQDDTSRPTLWIELGGQLESLSNTQDKFTPAFIVNPAPLEPRPWGPLPSIYGFGTPVDPGFPNIFAIENPLNAQDSPSQAFGGEGKISLQPHGSDWVFSASVRYGRTTGHKRVQPTVDIHPFMPNDKYVESLALFDDARGDYSESHMVLDFQAGRDVGLGLLGKNTTSTLNFGVRFAQFITKSAVRVDAVPNILAYQNWSGVPYTKYSLRFQSYLMRGQSERNFRGVGPSLSLEGSTPLIGNPGSIDLAVDWGINGAVLFGRQTAQVSHHTVHRDRLMFHKASSYGQNKLVYDNYSTSPARRKSIIVPNIGAFAGMSVNFPNAKVSLGYRADFFFGAMDAGIDRSHTQGMGFHGPFAKISMGLGG